MVEDITHLRLEVERRMLTMDQYNCRRKVKRVYGKKIGASNHRDYLKFLSEIGAHPHPSVLRGCVSGICNQKDSATCSRCRNYKTHLHISLLLSLWITRVDKDGSKTTENVIF